MRSEKYHELTLLAALMAFSLNAGFGAAQLEITITQMNDPGLLYSVIEPVLGALAGLALLLTAFFLYGFLTVLNRD